MMDGDDIEYMMVVGVMMIWVVVMLNYGMVMIGGGGGGDDGATFEGKVNKTFVQNQTNSTVGLVAAKTNTEEKNVEEHKEERKQASE